MNFPGASSPNTRAWGLGTSVAVVGNSCCKSTNWCVIILSITLWGALAQICTGPSSCGMVQETLDECTVDVPGAEVAVCAASSKRSSRSKNGFRAVAIAADTEATGIVVDAEATGIVSSRVSLSSTVCRAASAGVSEDSTWGPTSDCINLASSSAFLPAGLSPRSMRLRRRSRTVSVLNAGEAIVSNGKRWNKKPKIWKIWQRASVGANSK